MQVVWGGNRGRIPVGSLDDSTWDDTGHSLQIGRAWPVLHDLLVGHADCLVDISLQAYPVEDGYQGAESALEPFGVRQQVSGRVQAAGYGGGTIFLGAAERESGVRGVWGENRGQIPVDSLD